jgi:hypothetical protein
MADEGGSEASSYSNGDASNEAVSSADAGSDDQDESPPVVNDASEAGGDALGDAGPDDTSSDAGAASDGSAQDAAEAGAVGPRFVQGSASAFQTAPSATVTLQNLVGAGDAIIVAMDFDSVSAPVVTDSLGSSFAVVAHMLSGGDGMYLALAENVAGGMDDAVTVTVATAPSTYFEVYVHEYSGLARSNARDGANGGTGTHSGVDSMLGGFVMTHAPGELIFGFGTAGTAVAGTGFTTRLTVNQNITEDEIAGAPGLYQATATMLAGTGWQMITAAFYAQ